MARNKGKGGKGRKGGKKQRSFLTKASGRNAGTGIPAPDGTTNELDQKYNVWASATEYRPEWVNPNLTLHDAGLQHFAGVYAKAHGGLLLREICKDSHVPCETTDLPGDSPFRVRLTINGVWVSDGEGTDSKKSKWAASNNALIYMRVALGFPLITPNDVPKKAIKNVEYTCLWPGFPLTEPTDSQEDVMKVMGAARHQINLFLKAPEYLKLTINVNITKRHNLVNSLANKIGRMLDLSRLPHSVQGKRVITWKRSTSWHRMYNMRTPNKPFFHKSNHIVDVRTMSYKDLKKERLANGKLEIGQRQNNPQQNNQNPHGKKRKMTKVQVIEKNMSGTLVANRKALLCMSPRSLDRFFREGGEPSTDLPKRARQQLERFRKEHPNGAFYPYNKEWIGERFKSSRSIKGMRLFKGWDDTPVFLLEKSALICERTLKFSEAEHKDGEAVVELHIQGMLVTEGRGMAFAEAKEACARNAVNYFRSLPEAAMPPLKGKEWNHYLRMPHDDDVTWKISSDQLGRAGFLGTVSHKIGLDNIGYTMLRGLGWCEGKGLGKLEQGIPEPLPISKFYNNRKLMGLGYKSSLNGYFGFSEDDVLDLLVVFRNNRDIWKIEFADEFTPEKSLLVRDICGRAKIGSFKNKLRVFPDGTKRMIIWKKMKLAMGKTALRGMLNNPEEYELSDDEDDDVKEIVNDTGEGGKMVYDEQIYSNDEEDEYCAPETGDIYEERVEGDEGNGGGEDHDGVVYCSDEDNYNGIYYVENNNLDGDDYEDEECEGRTQFQSNEHFIDSNLASGLSFPEGPSASTLLNSSSGSASQADFVHPSRQNPSSVSHVTVPKAPRNADFQSLPMSAGVSFPRQKSPKVLLQQPPSQYGSAQPMSTARTTCVRPISQSSGYRPQLLPSPAPSTAHDPYGPSNPSYESQYGANPHQSHDEYSSSPHQPQHGYSSAEYDQPFSNQGEHASSAHSRRQEYGYGPSSPAGDGSRLPWSGSESWGPDQSNQPSSRNYGGQSGQNVGWY